MIPFLTARHSPFRVGVNLDSNEAVGATKAKEMSATNEQQGVPAGTVGFQLTYFQVAC